jgi:hypothetical protein
MASSTTNLAAGDLFFNQKTHMEELQLEETKKAIRQVFIDACITPFEDGRWKVYRRERFTKKKNKVLFIGTQFSNLYTAVDTPARGRVGVCVVFVCKYVLGHSREQPQEQLCRKPSSVERSQVAGPKMH